ncbi:MAG: hypothetical protein WDZ94_04285 [Patescibacteria group bacterium]
MPSLRPAQHTMFLLASIVLAYVWLQVAAVQQYSLQVFAVLIIGFLSYKKIRGGQFWHVLPEHTSLEMGVLTFAFLLLIGATGNTQSAVYPLAYLHVFFIVMTSHPVTAIIATSGIMLFHYALDGAPGMHTLQAIISLTFMLSVFLFAKKQYDANKKRKIKLEIEDKQLALLMDQERTLEDFMQKFLEPRLKQLKVLNEHPEENLTTISTQLDLIQTELEKISGSVLDETKIKPEQKRFDDNKNTE